MIKVAILGANGFIGSRLLEVFHLEQIAQVIPVVRSFSSLSRSARFDLQWHLADGLDQAALSQAFAGCEAVVDCLLGDRHTIVESITPIYKAAQQAGVKRLIYMSSAVVHGQAPAPGTHDDSPLVTKQSLWYNQAKVEAEVKLRRLAQNGATEIVILRPSIVFGPRSRFTAGIAEQILQEQLCLLDDGSGICNSIYIDNLVEAVRLCLQAKNISGQAFLLTDAEVVTWADFYRPLVESLGYNFNDLPRLTSQSLVPPAPDVVSQLRSQKLIQTALPFLPTKLKAAVKGFIQGWQGPSPDVCRSGISAEMALLQQCRYKLPGGKAQKLLGYQAPVSFQAGCRNSIAWLSFAGYPIRGDFPHAHQS